MAAVVGGIRFAGLAVEVEGVGPALVAGAADHVDQDVQPAERGGGLLHQSSDVVAVADVANEGAGVAASIADPSHGLVGAGLVDVGYHHR